MSTDVGYALPMTNTTPAHGLDTDTLALIFTAGQQDQFGRVSPLAVYGTTHNGRSICAARNMSPHVEGIARLMRHLRVESKMTNLHVSYDSCG